MIEHLNERQAKALASIITIGFIKELTDVGDNYRGTMFQYDEEVIPLEYIQTAQIFNDLGIPVNFTRSASHNDFPLIMAKPQGEGNDPLRSVSETYDQVRHLFDQFDRTAREVEEEDNVDGGAGKQTAPYGAYIGGVLQSSSDCAYTLIGPTNLMLYAPLFGHVRNNKLDDFNKASLEVGKAISVIKTVVDKQAGAGAWTVNYDILDALTDAQGYSEKLLFGSIHGMVISMLRYPYLTGKETHFEYALSPRTTKVSSCIPCSMFMYANGRPATSTHLGRGDFWNFPHPNNGRFPRQDAQRANWEHGIIKWYNIGLAVLSENGAFVYPNLQEFREPVTYKEHIPQMFLEALTFPGSFTQKIIDTFLT